MALALHIFCTKGDCSVFAPVLKHVLSLGGFLLLLASYSMKHLNKNNGWVGGYIPAYKTCMRQNSRTVRLFRQKKKNERKKEHTVCWKRISCTADNWDDSLITPQLPSKLREEEKWAGSWNKSERKWGKQSVKRHRETKTIQRKPRLISAQLKCQAWVDERGTWILSSHKFPLMLCYACTLCICLEGNRSS